MMIYRIKRELVQCGALCFAPGPATAGPAQTDLVPGDLSSYIGDQMTSVLK
jgi:hypothetical protein